METEEIENEGNRGQTEQKLSSSRLQENHDCGGQETEARDSETDPEQVLHGEQMLPLHDETAQEPKIRYLILEQPTRDRENSLHQL